MQQPPTTDGRGVGEELRSDATHIGSKAADRIHGEVDNRKGEAVGQAKNVSNAMHKAAGELDDSSPEWLRSAFRQGAEQIQRFADTIENKDSRELMRDAQELARNNPGTFLAACAAAGFAAARIFKAGGEPDSRQRFPSDAFDQSQPWGDGEQRFDRQFAGNEPSGRQLEDNPMFQDSADRQRSSLSGTTQRKTGGEFA